MSLELRPDELYPARAAVFFLCSLGALRLAAADARGALLLGTRAWQAAAALPAADACHSDVACALGAAAFHLRAFSLAASLFARALAARSGGDSRTHSLDVALPLHNLAAAAACADLPDLGFRLLKRCEEFMRIEVAPSHPRCELVAHNLTSLRCRGARLAVGV